MPRFLTRQVLCCQPCALTQELAQLDRAEREQALQLEGTENDIVVQEPQPSVRPLFFFTRFPRMLTLFKQVMSV